MSPGPARGRTTGADGGTGRRTGAGPARGRGSGGGGRTSGDGGGRRGPARRWQLVRAGSDAVPASTRRFMARARQRRVRAALPWAVAAGVLALAGLVAWTLLGTGLFGVREVRVAGAELVTPVQVRDAAAVPDGTPLARVDLAAAAGRIGALPAVQRATVTRDWPDALVVTVTERTPAATVPRDGQFVVVDAAGVVFRTLPEQPAGLPVVRVARPGPDDQDTRAALEVLAALTPRLRDELADVTVEGLARITLRLRGGREVVWGDATRSADKARVATALLDRDADRIDVSVPDVVTLR
ncbi:cell division protein FtsQ/DivIB [Micromonospora endolithica]|uniref:Cell division protein FtsQ n=1 Tax=Micromonospora endolithica TaxID=230091 RepID=A0A3A9ZR90_9ACTN|nr:FtsQ-type POTRA domain-containing protein [Micromonospora endolithica]RKN50782.1 FtsQ-type POTRA domain-containing protein [Micromonospora endolithica]TWJ20462.1 cell division protein FtsQ [Micromonospora endolithica]